MPDKLETQIFDKLISVYFPDEKPKAAKQLLIEKFNLELNNTCEAEQLESALADYYQQHGLLSFSTLPVATFYDNAVISVFDIHFYIESDDFKPFLYTKQFGLEINGVVETTVDMAQKVDIMTNLYEKYTYHNKLLEELNWNDHVEIVTRAYHSINPRNKVREAIEAMYSACSIRNTDNSYLPEEIGESYLEYIKGKRKEGTEKPYWGALSTFIKKGRYLKEEPIEGDSGNAAVEIFEYFEQT